VSTRRGARAARARARGVDGSMARWARRRDAWRGACGAGSGTRRREIAI
ncbi:MAG: hypothetical protein AVDCRST_MAG40-3288, partial [uncultured Gemmatimonadaceae bacterium]